MKKPNKISLVAAMAKNRVIGKDNKMPWHLPADLSHFKKTTINKPIIMGYKTWQSIGRPLPKRRNIVLSRQKNLSLEGAEVFNNIEELLVELANESEIMIIGGGNIYQQFLPLATHLYLTFIDLSVAGDTFFPDYQNQGDWQIISHQQHQSDEKNPYSYQFVTLWNPEAL